MLLSLQVSTAEEVINLGSLIQSVPSDMFSEMSSDEMEKSLPTLSNRSSLLDDVQRSSIMRNVSLNVSIFSITHTYIYDWMFIYSDP